MQRGVLFRGLREGRNSLPPSARTERCPVGFHTPVPIYEGTLGTGDRSICRFAQTLPGGIPVCKECRLVSHEPRSPPGNDERAYPHRQAVRGDPPAAPV